MNVPTAPAVLREIVEHTRRAVERAKSGAPVDALRARAAAVAPARAFFEAVTDPARPFAVIAEIKRRSPSAGLLRPEYDGDGFRPEDIARTYHRAGAAAISCLTDDRFFGGRLELLERVRGAAPLPVLRKDFLIDPWQVPESRAAGADAVLLIAECLDDTSIDRMIDDAAALGMTVLLESHDPANFERCARIVRDPWARRCLLGINNRDLATMRVDLSHTLTLVGRAADARVVVSESGVRDGADLARLARAGARIALVGEHLMRQPDPGAALRAMLRDAGGPAR